MSSLIELDLPFLSPYVDMCDLNSNLKLLTENEIAVVRAKLADKEDKRYGKKYFHEPESVIAPVSVDPAPALLAQRSWRNLWQHNHVPVVEQVAQPLPAQSNLGKYGIIKLRGELYAVYKGSNKNKHLYYQGEKERHLHPYTKLKLIQNLTTGEWRVLKIRSMPQQPISVKVEPHKLGDIIVDKKALEECYGKVNKEFESLQREGLTEGHVFAHYSKRRRYDICLIMPLVPGFALNLFLKNNFRLSPLRYVEIALMIMQAVRGLHAQRKLHGDIKCENIMYDFVNHKIRLIDFESLADMNKSYSVRKPLSGTDIYVAPELAKLLSVENGEEFSVYNEYTDAYATGIVLKVLFHFAVIIKKVFNVPLPAGEKEGDKYELGMPKEFTKDKPVIHRVARQLTAEDPLQRRMAPPLKQMNGNGFAHESKHENDSPSSHHYVLDEPIRIFSKLHAEMLIERENTPQKTLLLNIEDIIPHLSVQLNYHRLRRVFQQFDEIVLVSNSATIDKRKLIEIQKFLIEDDISKCRVPYFNKCLVVPRMADLASVPAYFKEKEPCAPRSFVYFDSARLSEENMADKIFMKNYQYTQHQLNLNGIGVVKVEKSKTIAQYTQEIAQVSSEDFQNVMKKLQIETRRLSQKYKLTDLKPGQLNNDSKLNLAMYRWFVLSQVITDFAHLEHGKQLSYITMSKMLNQILQDEKFSTKPRSRLARFFFTNARCVNNIEKIAGAIEKKNHEGLRP